MNVAVAGKGGAGKTTIAAALARLVARRGHDVVAVDADSNPNLAPALGVRPDVAAAPLPASVVSRRLDQPGLRQPVEEVIARYGLTAPDGIRMLTMGSPGHAEEGCLCAAHATVSAVLGALASRPGAFTVVDMEASPEHLSRGTARHAAVMVLVAEPYYRSLETVRRMAALTGELGIARLAVVANKVRERGDADAIAEFCARHSLQLAGEVPWDEAVTAADRDRASLVDAAPDSPAAVALNSLLVNLTA